MKRTIIMIVMMLMLVSAVSALSIQSPENKIYEESEIQIVITNNETYDNIYYTVDSAAEILACSNCSEFNDTLSFSEGEHTLTVFADFGNETHNESVRFNVSIPVDFNIDVQNPEEKTYQTSAVPLRIESDEELDYMNVTIGSIYENACENCSVINDTLTLTEGNYTLFVEGKLKNITKNETIEFEVKYPTNNSFELNIIKPEDKTYTKQHVPIHVESTKELDNLTLKIADVYNNSCESCDELYDNINLSDGNYTLVVKGFLGNETRQESVNFEVMKETPYYDEDGEPRFDTGFNKLPQAFENGELTDSELAEIIRNNKLNPGILNRLIKTGMLGEESIDAILDTQFKPQGIFNKLLGWLGFKQSTYASEIYETYNLTERHEQKIIQREDLPNKYAEQVKENLKNKVKEKTQYKNQEERQNQVQEETKPENYQGGNQGKIPPGQAKKTSNGQAKVPPGQAKKN